MKINSLKTKIWKYLILFSILILAFLWLFQVIFLDSYYETVKTKEINKIINNIEKNYKQQNFEAILENLAYDKSVCIELNNGNQTIYSSSIMSHGCFIEGSKPNNEFNYKYDFVNSHLKRQQYKIINPRFKNKTLVSALKLTDNLYVYVNASLEPIDETTKILTSQLIIVTLLVLILSFIIGYFISKKISKPIEKINKAAKTMANGSYDIVFSENEKIKELNELSNTLNTAKNELAKTEELRRELLANVSHDLKTPLTMIKAYAEMVRDLTFKNKEKRENNLNIIIDEVDRLNLLVNDILELSKIKSNIKELNLEKFDLTELIKTIISRYEIFSLTEHYHFIFNQNEPIPIIADKKKMEQVIYNLICNAINYTGKDKKIIIDIIISVQKIRVEIKDTGKGIKKEDINHIWDKYYKTDKTHHRNVIGTGLGLSIVKNILVAHNYIYGVVSNEGKGTTFYFEIPNSKISNN